MSTDALNFAPHMPDVDVVPDIEAVFAEARRLAKWDEVKGSSPVVITPGHRILFPLPSTPPETMADQHVAAIERMVPRDPPLNITVIALNTVDTLIENRWIKSIPFAGYLIGLAYIGHNVIVTEGHSSVLAAASAGADLLIVDGGMVPFLQKDWVEVADAQLRSKQILVLNRDGTAQRIVRNTTAATSTMASPAKRPWWKLW